MQSLKSELFYEAHFDLAAPQTIKSPSGTRNIFLATGGWMKSPKFTVKQFLAGGGDWAKIRNDGVTELDVRATFILDDDSLVYMTYGGINVMPQAVAGRIFAGEDVDPEEYYFRITPRFQTGSETYNWLNNIVCVGIGKVGPKLQWVEYTTFQIL